MNNTLLCWGDARTAACGGGTGIITGRPVPVPIGEGIEWAKVDAGNGTNCGLSTTGKAYCWGQGSSGERGDGDLDDLFTVVEEVDSDLRFSDISSGNSHAAGITHSDYSRVSLGVGWGKDTDSMLGNDNTVEERTYPVSIYGHYDWAMLAGADDHTCGIKQDGSLWCWGSNNFGELGNNDLGTNSNIPVQEDLGKTWIHVTASQDITCAIDTQRQGFCWGDDTGDAGRVGNGGPGANVAVPVKLAGGHLWKNIYAGLYVVCGVTVTGDGYCWGEENDGDLGNAGGTTDTVYEPTPVDGTHKWLKIIPSDGPQHFTCGLRTDGAAYCWGDDSEGSLGDGAGDSGTQASPVAVGGGFTFADIGGGGAICGIEADGDAYCWGRGNNGEMGTDAGGTDYFVPATEVSGGYKWKKIVGGYKHFCGLTTANKVYCWGNNDAGQLGAGFTNTGSTSDTPQPVLMQAEVANLWKGSEGGYATINNYENVTASSCYYGSTLKFQDLYTSDTATDLLTDEIEIIGVMGTCPLSVISDSPSMTIYLNTVAQSGSSINVQNGDKIYLEIESPGSVGDSYSTFISIGNTQSTHTTTTDEKMVFTTTATFQGNLGGLTGADSACQSAADAEGLEGTYLAWLSDDTGYPAARFSHWNYIYRMAEPIRKASDNWADLTDGSVDDHMRRSEDGTFLGAPRQSWTNTGNDGTMYGSDHCNNWTNSSNSYQGAIGETDSGSNWTVSAPYDCDQFVRIYCFEQ